MVENAIFDPRAPRRSNVVCVASWDFPVPGRFGSVLSWAGFGTKSNTDYVAKTVETGVETMLKPGVETRLKPGGNPGGLKPPIPPMRTPRLERGIRNGATARRLADSDSESLGTANIKCIS